MLSIFKLGKTRIPHKKTTAEMKAVEIASPGEVLIPMVHHIGAPAVPIVKPADHVYVGSLIAEAGGFVSAPIHSSVSGTVKKIENYLLQNGATCPAVLIESDGKMELDPAITPPKIESFGDLSSAVKNSGLVGLGGAGFPTHVKLDPSKVSSETKLLINAAECEPYITADTRTMIDDKEYVKSGVDIITSLSGISEVIIGIEENKLEAVAVMKETFADNPSVKIDVLPSTYPQGAEKILIYNATGKVVPESGLPSDVGVLLLNVTTVAFIAKYVETGIPLVKKCITVDGSAVLNPGNYIVPVGMKISDVFGAAGGIADNVEKVIYGGPMMGVAVYSLDAPVLKNTNALVAFSEKEAKLPKSTACIHCGRCVSVCPMGLNPTVYAKAMKLDDKGVRAERIADAKIQLCIECGSCSFVCPAKRPLVENNRLSKAFMREYAKELAETEARNKEEEEKE